MNKKIIGLIIILIIVCAVAVGVYFLTPHYKTFSDENIQVEIPSDVNFVVNETTSEGVKTLAYIPNLANETEISIFDMIPTLINPSGTLKSDSTSINLISVDSSVSYAQEIYSYSKSGIKESFSGFETVDGSQYNYNGTIYNTTNQTATIPVYIIPIFDDDTKTIALLLSTDLGTVVHMAETFKIK